MKFSLKKLVLKIGIISLLTTSMVAATGSFVLAKEITVLKGQDQRVISGNLFQKVGNVLEKNGIDLGDEYVVDVDSDTFLLAVDEVEVLKKNKGSLVADGQIINYNSGAQTVGQLLVEEGIELGDLDRVKPNKAASLSEISLVELIRVEVSELPLEETIPYKTIQKENPDLEKGRTKIIQEGLAGSKSLVERVLFENGKESRRSIIHQTIRKEPVDQILEVGTKELLVKRSEEMDKTPVEQPVVEQVQAPKPVEEKVEKSVPEEAPKVAPPVQQPITEAGVKRVLNCTAYTATGNATASGVMPRSNHTIAAWSGLPFGTKVYIPALQTTFTVEDRGGAVTEGIIDIYMDTYNECIQFGRQNLEAYITYP